MQPMSTGTFRRNVCKHLVVSKWRLKEFWQMATGRILANGEWKGLGKWTIEGFGSPKLRNSYPDVIEFRYAKNRNGSKKETMTFQTIVGTTFITTCSHVGRVD